MRQWQRAKLTTRCGRCGEPVYYGQPLLVLSSSQGWRLSRCTSCAGEPVPSELPALEERRQIVQASAPVTLATLARDWKQKASGS